MSPGPTFIVPRGTETVVRFINNATVPNSVHLHGSPSRAAFDGWAEDMTNPGEFKDYYYPNSQSARTLWYHDHAMHSVCHVTHNSLSHTNIEKTAESVYTGQAGMYILHDEAEDALNLPSGYGTYDIPLILTTKQYNADGTLFSTNGVTDHLFGDVIEVVSFLLQQFKYLTRTLILHRTVKSGHSSMLSLASTASESSMPLFLALLASSLQGALP